MVAQVWEYKCQECRCGRTGIRSTAVRSTGVGEQVCEYISVSTGV